MNFLRGFSLNTTSTLLVYGLGFLNHVLLSRHLSENAYGDLAFWITTVMFGTLVVGEWLNRGNTYIVGREGAKSQVFGNALIYGLALILLPALAGLLWWLGQRSLALVPFLLSAGLIALTALQKSALGIALGEDRIKLYALIPLVFIVFYLGGNALLAFDQALSLHRVMAVWLLAMGASALAAFVGLWRGTAGFAGADQTVFKKTARIGLRGALSYILIFLLFRSNVWIIEYLMGSTTLATYRIVINLADLIQHLPNVAGAVLLAKVVRGQDEKSELSLPVAQAALLFSLASAAAIVLLGPFLIQLSFPKYTAAYPILLWLLPGLVCTGFASVFNTKLGGQGYPPITLWAPAIALAVNVPLNFILITHMGLPGAALANTLSYILWALIITSHYRRRAHLPWSSFLHLPPLKPTIKK